MTERQTIHAVTKEPLFVQSNRRNSAQNDVTELDSVRTSISSDHISSIGISKIDEISAWTIEQSNSDCSCS